MRTSTCGNSASESARSIQAIGPEKQNKEQRANITGALRTRQSKKYRYFKIGSRKVSRQIIHSAVSRS